MLAGLAAIAAHTPRLLGLLSGNPNVDLLLLRNVALLALPFLAWFYVRRNRLGPRQALVIAAPFVIGAAVVNLYP